MAVTIAFIWWKEVKINDYKNIGQLRFLGESFFFVCLFVFCFLLLFFWGVIEHLKAGQVIWITLITRSHLLPEKSILFCSRKSFV